MNVKELIEELENWKNLDTEITIGGFPISRITPAEVGASLQILPDTPDGVREITCRGNVYNCLSAEDIWALEDEIRDLEDENSNYYDDIERMEYEERELKDALEKAQKWTKKYSDYLTNLFKGPELMEMKEILGSDSELKQVEQDLKTIDRAFDMAGDY